MLTQICSTQPEYTKSVALPLCSPSGISIVNMCYFDEGATTSLNGTVLLLDGIVTTEFLYWKVILKMAEEGYRVVAPLVTSIGNDNQVRHDGFGNPFDHKVTQARLIKSLLNTLSISQPVKVVGHGPIGRAIGAALATEYPHFVKRFIVVDFLNEINSNSEATEKVTTPRGSSKECSANQTLVLRLEENPLEVRLASSPSSRRFRDSPDEALEPTNVDNIPVHKASRSSIRSKNGLSLGNDLGLRLSFLGIEDKYFPALIRLL